MKRVFAHSLFFMALVTMSLAGSAHAQDNLRQTLFEEAKDALIAANKADASILTPTAYSEGAGHYKKAEELLERGGNIDRIRSELAKAVSAWSGALDATEVARITLSNAILARADAVSAEAEKYAPEAWSDGVDAFQDAAVTLESGSLKSAERKGAKAESFFRAAELAAIKANYLNETQALLDQADDLKADRYAPATFARATSLFAEAERELTANRYDTDRPRSLAQDAKHEARVAIYLAQNLKRVEREREQLEAFVVDWQTPVRRIGAALDIPVYFDNGYEEPTGKLVARVEELLETNRVQAQDLAERKAQLRDLEAQIASLEESLGGASEERLALAAQLDQQARIKAKFATIERLFERDEAIVLRSGNDVILRLVGLTFDSGQAEIDSDKFALLYKVEQAIKQFDRSTIDVEGHTDAFGSDETNLELSTERATAVKTYMIGSMGLTDSQVTATGYGETRPIANNETKEGRAKNRRIDVVIHPQL
jgi:outer membrane protein OmpA-like peptidoglycan-associated protein